MNRDTVLACAYAVLSVVVGVLLIRGGTLPRQLERAGAGVDSHPGAAPGAGSASAAGEEVELEIGPAGLRAVRQEDGRDRLAQAILPEEPDARRTSVGVEDVGVVENDRDGPYEGGLPVRATPLLARGIPEVEEVASLLSGAGVAPPRLEGSLRGVFGHVQRLAFFKERFAAESTRLAERLQRTATGALPPDTGMFGPGWRADSWRRRHDAYTDYVRRDLQVRLGIQEGDVAERLVAIADALAARSQLVAGPVTVSPPAPEATAGAISP